MPRAAAGPLCWSPASERYGRRTLGASARVALATHASSEPRFRGPTPFILAVAEASIALPNPHVDHRSPRQSRGFVFRAPLCHDPARSRVSANELQNFRRNLDAKRSVAASHHAPRGATVRPARCERACRMNVERGFRRLAVVLSVLLVGVG